MTRYSWWQWSLLIAGGFGINMPALAAEQVILNYGPLSRTVAVADLEALAATGTAPERLAALLTMANQPASKLQAALTDGIEANPVLLDRVLNSWPGEWALDQMGQVIHPPSGRASRQALRSALVLSAQDDNHVTLLEVLQHYPTNEVEVEADRLEEVYNDLETLMEPFS
ncbi:hypothetical protein XM38_018730 [Halomicronema hongdechloris C2206]|uniref:DUF1400 domain-containing protein n=1 Tax=Halomicronema hongdechloris C2206 TaxID=1641165 RepID=A0A1Z3HKV6_9CYAN|nr:alpha/beta hydrolase [Halomicronema hongdechloris]ASC70925.1 hypothetical protein XM38_018730 [Halomicronema hongdechloris C2206]